jgi:multicomponent Na+:H+ antiporter subunit E
MLGLHILLAASIAAFADALSPLGVVGAFVLVYLVMKFGARLIRVDRYVQRVELGTAFVFWFSFEIFRASVDVARLVVAGRVRTSPAVVPVQLEERSEGVATLVGLLLTLTPGTMALEYEPQTGVMYIHALDTDSVEKVEAGVRQIESRLLAWIDPDRLGRESRS